MNVRRGMARLWLVLTVLWEGALAWRIDVRLGQGLPWQKVGAEELAWAVIPPLAAIAVLAIVGWILAGFAENSPKQQ